MQRLEAVGQLTSGVAHDFNNLLTVVLGNIGFLETALSTRAGIDGKIAQRLGYMRAAAERGAKLTDQLLSFSRRQRLEPKLLDLNETVAGMRDLLQSTMGGSIRIETKLQSRSVAGDGRSDAARTRHAQPGDQRARRHAGRRPLGGPRPRMSRWDRRCTRRSRRPATMSRFASPIPAPA